MTTAPLPASLLPEGVSSRIVPDVNGLDMHVLTAGAADQPCILLLHGFPELGYSWRHIMHPLARAGFHVIAPDQRGYGRTGGWGFEYDGDLEAFRFPNLVLDALALVHALGHHQVAAVVGHDFGAPLAAWCALIRPDVFRALALMSAPFAGPPPLPLGGPSTALRPPQRAGERASIHEQLARLDPPRMHYQRYFCTRQANADMHRAPQGLPAFLRAYFHCKSADWAGNEPHPLSAFTAEQLAQLPPYYVMPHGATMADVVATMAPPADAVCAWLTDDELGVYVREFARTGLQGGLNWYRSAADPRARDALRLFAGRTIDVPACFVAGSADWGVYQQPGALVRMQRHACTDLRGCHLIERAGHWVQQEQPAAVVERLLAFLDELRPIDAV